ncbi:MAG: T9SS type A sorting domain-containing protein [Mucilaginibacter sp.]
MKTRLLKIYIFSIVLLVLCAGKSYAQTTYDWTGVKSFYWDNPGNWLVSGSVPATYPGQSGSTDIVNIGVNYFYSGFGPTYFPWIRAGYTINVASLTIGDNTSINSTSQVYNYFAVDGTLNVTGTILQLHSNNLGKTGDGSPGFPLNYDFVVHTIYTGSGNINAATFQVGDNTLPPVGISNVTRVNLSAQGWDPCPTIVISGDFIINSMSANDASTMYVNRLNNAEVGIYDGNLTIGGTFKLTNSGVSGYDPLNYNSSQTQFQPHAWFSAQVYNTGFTTNINLKGATALYSTPASVTAPAVGKIGNNVFDFFYIDRTAWTSGVISNFNTLDKVIVNYSGNVDQKVYTNASFPNNSILDQNGGVSEYLNFSGSGKKTIDQTTNLPLVISGDMTLATGTETVDLSTNNPTVTLNNANVVITNYGNGNPAQYLTYTVPVKSSLSTAANTTFQNGTTALTIPGTTTNGGTFNTTTGTLTFSGALTNSGTFNETAAGTINLNNTYLNTGIFKATAGTTNINQSGAQSLTDNSAANQGTTFFNLNVQNGGTKTLSGSGAGQFYVSSNGVLTMVSTTALAANGFLTLNSDVTGTATVAVIPADCSITGNVTAQRYVTATRAYRLVSSPVYASNDGTNNIYSINYLKTNSYLTGSGGGFDKSGNPTLYLFRENLAPTYSSFLTSNFRGIIDISTPPNYTLSDASYPTTNIPVGNGYLFYYRGSRKQATLATLTTAGAAATNDTLNASGILNQGTITVHDWYTPSSANLGYTTASADPTIEGFNLVGNPYASSIDWDKSDSTVTTAPIYRPHTAPFIYQLNPTSGNYSVYQAGTPGGLNTQGVANSNIIASGEGFFVQALSSSAQLTFTESAKSNTQVTGINLYMGKPVASNPVSYLRLQMAMDSVNTDGMMIFFKDNAQSTFSPAEDARYKTGTGKVTLSSFSSDKVALAINQLPLSKGLIIPLNVSATANGTYKISLNSIIGVPQLYDVWLKDAFTRDSVNLRVTSAYSFTINKSDSTTFGSKRFSIVMLQDPALAYKLLSFDANKVNNTAVQLVWKTQNEQNYTHFTVERSNDNGITFNVVGGMNSSTLGTYSLLDKSPLNGDNKYRLKQEDYNNTITYSDVVDVIYSDKSSASASSLNVYPNPAVSNIQLTIVPKSAVNTTYNIRVTNSTGLVVKTALIKQTQWETNVSNLLTGTYLIQVTDNNDNSIVGQTKFIKL